jgi:hypothetical protein
MENLVLLDHIDILSTLSFISEGLLTVQLDKIYTRVIRSSAYVRARLYAPSSKLPALERVP